MRPGPFTAARPLTFVVSFDGAANFTHVTLRLVHPARNAFSAGMDPVVVRSRPTAPPDPPLPPPNPIPVAVAVPTACLPLTWFTDPFYATMRKMVRPPTSTTRRKELVVKQKMPREAFEQIFSELQENDAVGVTRDLMTGMLVPTDPSGGINRFDFTIKRGSVTDKIFHGTLEVPEPQQPARMRTVADVAQIEEEDIYEVESIVASRQVGTKRKRTEYQ